MIFNKANLTAKLKNEGIFYTPIEAFKTVFARLTQGIDLSRVKTVYDPACGIGNLFAVTDEHCEKYGQDINASQLLIAARQLKNFHYAEGDTLTHPAFTDKRFDLILANPPFSIKWDNTPWKADARFNRAPAAAPASKADYAFILHCLHGLNDNGYAVIIGFPGILYRGASEGKIRAWLIEKGHIHRVQAIAAKTFEDTAIATVALLIRKQPTNSIIFINEQGEEISATLEQIRENGYNLTPDRYFPQPEKAAPSIEAIRAHDEQCKERFFQNFKKTLTLDIFIERTFYPETATASILADLSRFRELIDELTVQALEPVQTD